MVAEKREQHKSRQADTETDAPPQDELIPDKLAKVPNPLCHNVFLEVAGILPPEFYPLNKTHPEITLPLPVAKGVELVQYIDYKR